MRSFTNKIITVCNLYSPLYEHYPICTMVITDIIMIILDIFVKENIFFYYHCLRDPSVYTTKR